MVGRDCFDKTGWMVDREPHERKEDNHHGQEHFILFFCSFEELRIFQSVFIVIKKNSISFLTINRETFQDFVTNLIKKKS